MSCQKPEAPENATRLIWRFYSLLDAVRRLCFHGFRGHQLGPMAARRHPRLLRPERLSRARSRHSSLRRPENYLERVYRHPRYLASSILAAYITLLGFPSANSLSFGRYIMRASTGEESDGWPARGIAVGVVVFAVTIHSVAPKWGIRLFSLLGIFKIPTLVFVIFSGFAALAGRRQVPDPHNFEDAFLSDGGGGAYAYAKALLTIVYSYSSWEGSTYVMGEMKLPGRTLSIAAPSAIGIVTVLYLLVNDRTYMYVAYWQF